MKFCQHCGAQLMDEAVICPRCGCAVAHKRAYNQSMNGKANGTDDLATAAKVFLILSCVICGCALFPLAWMLPITITIFDKLKRGEPIGTGLKVCTLIFVNIIAGILLLCRDDEN